MASLSEVAPQARTFIKFGVIALLVMMVGRVILVGAYNYWRKLNPPPPPPPDVKFGKLPKLSFPQKEQPELSYRLETRTGGLPSKLPEQYEVYFMPIKKPSLLAFDNAKGIANRLEFIEEPKQLSETSYRWDSLEPVPSSLTMDIIYGSFILDRRWQDDPSYATPNLILSEVQATEKVYNLLSRIDLLPEDIRGGTSEVQPLRGEGGKIMDAVALRDAQFVRVNLYRADVGETPVVNPRAERGLITAIVAMQREEEKQMVQLDYNYFPVETETVAVYPLIGVAEAWQRMQMGGGYISSIVAGTGEVVVREVYLAYYDSEKPQQYLQPVYVFEGDREFRGIVPAVSDNWVE